MENKKARIIKNNTADFRGFLCRKIFLNLFFKKCLTFLNFQFILCGLSSWEPIKLCSQPLKFGGLRNERLERGTGKTANIVNKSSSSKFKKGCADS